MKTIEELGQDITSEIVRARKMWNPEFDKRNTLNDWGSYINSYVAGATEMGASKESVVKNFRKAAGLCLSALYHTENDILTPRHYDGNTRPESLPDIGG